MSEWSFLYNYFQNIHLGKISESMVVVFTQLILLSTDFANTIQALEDGSFWFVVPKVPI